MAQITREQAFENGKNYADAQKAKSVLPLVFVGGVGALFGSLKFAGKMKRYLATFFGFFIGLIMMIVFVVTSGSATNAKLYDSATVRFDDTTKGVVAVVGDKETSFDGVRKGVDGYSYDSGKLTYAGDVEFMLIGRAPTDNSSAAQEAAKKKAVPFFLVSDGVSEDPDTWRYINKDGVMTYTQIVSSFGASAVTWRNFSNEKYEVTEATDGSYNLTVTCSDKVAPTTYTITLPNDIVAKDIQLTYDGVKAADQLFTLKDGKFETVSSFLVTYNEETKTFESSELYLHNGSYRFQSAMVFICLALFLVSFVANIVFLVMQKNSSNKYVNYVKACAKSLDKNERSAFTNAMMNAAMASDWDKANEILNAAGILDESEAKSEL